MKLYRNIERTAVENYGVKDDEYIGESLEEKIRRVTETNQPIVTGKQIGRAHV